MSERYPEQCRIVNPSEEGGMQRITSQNNEILTVLLLAHGRISASKYVFNLTFEQTHTDGFGEVIVDPKR